jgi:hypothetical protein
VKRVFPGLLEKSYLVKSDQKIVRECSSAVEHFLLNLKRGRGFDTYLHKRRSGHSLQFLVVIQDMGRLCEESNVCIAQRLEHFQLNL